MSSGRSAYDDSYEARLERADTGYWWIKLALARIAADAEPTLTGDENRTGKFFLLKTTVDKIEPQLQELFTNMD